MFVVLELSSVIVDQKLYDCMLVPGNPIDKRTGFSSIHTKHLNLLNTWCKGVDFMSTQTFLGHFVSMPHHTCSGVSATGPH